MSFIADPRIVVSIGATTILTRGGVSWQHLQNDWARTGRGIAYSANFEFRTVT
jgi:hypothetical protein